jgi:hypothetical protein
MANGSSTFSVPPWTTRPTEDLTAFGVCQASCPWRGGPPQQCAMGPCCPRRCWGCEREWPYDAAGRHIGPQKFPALNRWECNRVKWLGLRGEQPCTDRSGEVLWVNSQGVGQQWMNDTQTVVAWVLADGTVKGGLPFSAIAPTVATVSAWPTAVPPVPTKIVSHGTYLATRNLRYG